MHSFSLDSTKAELAHWADIRAESLPDAPWADLRTSDIAYPVLSCAPGSGEKVVVLAQFAPTLALEPEAYGLQIKIGSIGESFTAKASSVEILRRPCLVPVRSFLATRLAINGTTEPYSFALVSGDIIGLAGILEERTGAGARRRCTYGVLHVDSPPLLRPFFEEWPAIIDPSGYGSWLQWDGISEAAYSRSIRPLPSIALREWYTLPAHKEHAARIDASRRPSRFAENRARSKPV